MSWVRIRQKMLDAKAQAEASPANWSGIAYDPKPPILEAELEALEDELGVRFPEDYRQFLLTIGNGGVGPGYGLLPVRDGIEERGSSIYGLDEPFEPPSSVANCLERSMPGMHLITYDGCAYYTGLVVSGPAAGTVWSYVEVSPGWIPLLDGCVDEGGAPYALRGSSVADYQDWYRAMLLPVNDQRRLTFAAWYERWLDDVLAQTASA